MQSVITQINHAIGASGVTNQACKNVVEQYGQTIIDLLFSEVSLVSITSILLFHELFFGIFLFKVVIIFCACS